MSIKIAVSGKSGCGNSSVSRIVANTLGLRLINFTFRNMAQEMGISFEEFCKRAENDKQYDLLLDNKQIELALPGDCVLGSRLAIWLLKDADLKVYLDATLDARAKRISSRENIGIDASRELTAARDKRDRDRFIRLYNIDNNDFQFADLIINTEKGDQYYVAEQIIKAAQLL